MTDEIKQENTEVTPEATVEAVVSAPTSAPRPAGRDERRPFQKNRRGPKRDVRERVKPEFDQKIIQIRRVTRVTSGGRRMSFSVAIVAGDRKGKIGIGTGKGIDTQISIEKALRDAKKNMITVPLTKDLSIPHDVKHKYSSARISIVPAPNRGLIAGSAVRTVLELAGVTNVNAKVHSPSKNKLNIARAAIEALSMLKKPKVIDSKKA
ncbi:MAG: ribosomal protein small subunit ribosomal protein [Candidatus Parcubacteria bacterium]|jgi:small subunit ribosomal protein S5